MDPHDIAPRPGQVPARVPATAGAPAGLALPALPTRAGRSHAGRIVHALAASPRASLYVRSQLVAPSPPMVRDLSLRLRAGSTASH